VGEEIKNSSVTSKECGPNAMFELSLGSKDEWWSAGIAAAF
jgi:hypothetical protein